MSIALLLPAAADRRGAGLGVGGTSTARAACLVETPTLPGRGPGELWPFGAGVAASPAVVASFAACVGLGLGTPVVCAGVALGRLTGRGDDVGAGVARAMTGATVGAAVGGAVGAGGRNVGLTVGAAVGAGGRNVGLTVGAVVGTGVGAAVGGIFTATACVSIDGTAVGTAGSSFCGFGS